MVLNGQFFRKLAIWLRRGSLLGGGFAFLLIIGQQCSNTNLVATELNNFSLSSNPYALAAPSQYPAIRKYIILVDMSHSMIAGPCPQDVDAGLLFQITPPYQPYDPNKHVGSATDHRADGSSCQVNPTLSIEQASITTTENLNSAPPLFYQTTLGTDWEGDRFTMIRTWINQIVSSSTAETLQNTQFIIYPFSGGEYQNKILVGYPLQLQFYNAGDAQLTAALDFLQGEQYINLTLAESSYLYRYQNQTMGTSSPGALIQQLYTVLNQDMYNLNLNGQLTYAEYRLIMLSDGMWTPLESQIENTLSAFPDCSSCASDPTSCQDVCGEFVQNMKTAWGDPENQSLTQLNFNFGMIQTLPEYYGSGTVSVDFVDLKPERSLALFPGQQTFYQQLVPLFQSKNRTATIWPAEDATPPFSLALSPNGTVMFKLTNLYALNTNAVYDANGVLQADSDGDGLSDVQEAQYGTDPTNPRSDGVCLDSLAVNPAFKDRCEALAQAKSCDPTLDSDGDSLNECEEMVLGTNPFGFDSDGDSIPDILEWIYGYNPLVSDINLDSNSDGVPNLVNFASGLGPMADFGHFKAENLLPQYLLNYLNKIQIQDPVFGSIWVDQYNLLIQSIPTIATAPVPEAAGGPLYASRNSANPQAMAANLIPPSQQLISHTAVANSNMLLIIARMIDVNNPGRAYWRLYKTPLFVGVPITQSTVDLSQLVEIRTIDLNSGTGN